MWPLFIVRETGKWGRVNEEDMQQRVAGWALNLRLLQEDCSLCVWATCSNERATQRPSANHTLIFAQGENKLDHLIKTRQLIVKTSTEVSFVSNFTLNVLHNNIQRVVVDELYFMKTTLSDYNLLAVLQISFFPSYASTST